MDGREATERIKEDPVLSSIPVVALTASAMKEEEEILRKISDGYLKKPVTKGQLVSELMRFLPHRRDVTNIVKEEETGNEEWSSDLLTEEDLELLPKLLDLLDHEHRNWEELNQTLTINDIELFASRMQEEGHRFGYVPLATWGETLATQVSMFDMGALPATLEEFPRIVEKLRTLVNLS